MNILVKIDRWLAKFRKPYLAKPIGSFNGWLLFSQEEYAKTARNYMSAEERKVYEQHLADFKSYTEAELVPVLAYQPMFRKALVTSMENIKGEFVQ